MAAVGDGLSNTGCVSDGELAITFKISAVAVCRSSASLVSLNSRAFWIAMTAWSAKLRSRLHSFSLNGFIEVRPTKIEPMARSSHSMGASAIE